MRSVSKTDSPAIDHGSDGSMACATIINDPATRFAFGRNWQRFLRLLDEQRIACAEQSLRDMLEITTLRSLSFLDIGSGSGLSTVARAFSRPVPACHGAVG